MAGRCPSHRPANRADGSRARAGATVNGGYRPVMARWLPKRLPFDGIGDSVLTAVDKAVEQRWEAAVARAGALPAGSVEERVEQATAAFVRELTLIGAASGGAAAVPGAGTATALATTAADLGWFTLRISDLILTIAAVHGHEGASVEERRSWILSVLAFGDEAAPGLLGLMAEIGPGLRSRTAGGGGLSAATLVAVNRRLARSVATRYGTRRGAAALGRLLPFGIGAAVGGSTNYFGARAVARHAHELFRTLPGAGAIVVEGRPTL